MSAGRGSDLPDVAVAFGFFALVIAGIMFVIDLVGWGVAIIFKFEWLAGGIALVATGILVLGLLSMFVGYLLEGP